MKPGRVISAIFAVCFTLMWVNNPFAQTAAQLESSLGNPAMQYRMGVRYWWWGSNIDRTEIAWQLQQMKDLDRSGTAADAEC